MATARSPPRSWLLSSDTILSSASKASTILRGLTSAVSSPERWSEGSLKTWFYGFVPVVASPLDRRMMGSERSSMITTECFVLSMLETATMEGVILELLARPLFRVRIKNPTRERGLRIWGYEILVIVDIHESKGLLRFPEFIEEVNRDRPIDDRASDITLLKSNVFYIKVIVFILGQCARSMQ
ncbi:hypothetical protein V6N12_055836 [Hibiscus sabdariffa]|uniref:Uncharacterized protein n=1 Tax=Hibiscus sabdariffa TaxID=183260 RepID=A0ABR2AMP7_9ROSI